MADVVGEIWADITCKSKIVDSQLFVWKFREFPNQELLKFSAFGANAVFTDEPENVRYILSEGAMAGKVGIGNEFHEQWVQFLGPSVFNLDGVCIWSSVELAFDMLIVPPGKMENCSFFFEEAIHTEQTCRSGRF